VRIAVVGLGQIAKLCLPPYSARDDVEVVGLCDLDPVRVEHWGEVFPKAVRTTDMDTLLALDADVVDVLVPTPAHADVVTRVLDAGFHVQVQKPMARSVPDADRMLAAAARTGATLRVMEDYVCFPPLVKLKEIVDSGELGPAQTAHMKIIATPTGGWEVDPSSYEWQFAQARDGHGILTFDHGWHQLAVAHWLFGPIGRVFGWIRKTKISEDFVLDTPATFVWEHENGVRVVLDITLAHEMYYRSDYYSDDERVEVVGTRGYVRCNHISGRGLEQPAVVMYRDGELQQFHVPDLPPDAFAASAAHGIEYFRTGEGSLLLDGKTARDILLSLLAALESANQGVPIDVAEFREPR
jgi:predicted dehydrogenase